MDALIQMIANAPILSVIIFLPVAGAIIIMLMSPAKSHRIKWFAFWVSVATFLISLFLLAGGGGFERFSHVEQYPWLPRNN